MNTERIERFDIEPHAGRIELRMRQVPNALGVALVALAVLGVTWWFGPYGPRPVTALARADWFYWLWSGFFALVLVLSLAGSAYREDWTITEREIVAIKSAGFWRATHRVAAGSRLRMRVEQITGGDDTPVFPYRLHFLDADRKETGLYVQLQQAASVERFLDALRPALNLDVEGSTRR